jgi:hypothetical protein
MHNHSFTEEYPQSVVISVTDVDERPAFVNR